MGGNHYQTLQVARDASAGEIRAAYRALTRRHHPDRNPRDANASRTMATINVAYQVLSDPAARRAHDEWIELAAAPRDAAPAAAAWRDAAPAPAPAPAAAAAAAAWHGGARPHVSPFTVHAPSLAGGQHLAPQDDLDDTHTPGMRLLAGFALVALLGFAVAVASVLLRRPPEPPTPAATRAAPPAATYVLAATAPNGQPWPEESGYVAGYARRNGGGRSEVTVDNTRNDADVFVKLVCLDGAEPVPVRTVLVRAHGVFRLTDLAFGTYDLRYRDLRDGRLSRSQFFTLEELTTVNGIRPSSVNVPLHAANAGRVHVYGLSEAEF